MQQLTPSQRALLRIVCWAAWADGDFAPEERGLLERVVARLLALETDDGLAVDAVHALALEQLQNVDLAVLVAALADADERQLAVKLALQMISVAQGPDEQAPINPAEKRAYRQLIELLALPDAVVEQAEWAAREELARKPSLLELLSDALGRFGAWPADRAVIDGTLPLGTWL